MPHAQGKEPLRAIDVDALYGPVRTVVPDHGENRVAEVDVLITAGIRRPVVVTRVIRRWRSLYQSSPEIHKV